MTGLKKTLRGRGRRMVTGIGILMLLALAAAAALILAVYFMETHLPPEKDADAILVLGAQVKEDGTLSVALTRRVTVALEAYREQRRPVICCGGQGSNEPRSEGETMRDWLLAEGCDPEDVIAETASVNTRENLVNAKAILGGLGCVRPLIVTSDYHVPRALALARQVGLDACGRGSPSKPEYFIRNHLQEGLSWIKFVLESLRV